MFDRTFLWKYRYLYSVYQNVPFGTLEEILTKELKIASETLLFNHMMCKLWTYCFHYMQFQSIAIHMMQNYTD